MRRFFIVGCQRSGTTLLRLILAGHPAIYCYDETLAYARLRDGQASEALGYELVCYKIPRWTEQLNIPVLADEGHDIVAARFYSREPIIFMIRDVRDVVASMKKFTFQMDQRDVSWLDAWVPRILLAKSRDEYVRRRYKES
jgi:hypothetical protein